MKRLLFFTHNIFDRDNPVGWRIQQYFPYLEKRGFQVSLLTSQAPLKHVLQAMSAADIVWIQRLLPNPVKLALYRRFSKKIVYDFDDAVMLGQRRPSRTRAARFRQMMGSADLVFCGNTFLLEQALAHRPAAGRNTFRVPTVVDTNEYPVKLHGQGTPFVVGWIGTASTLRYVSAIQDVLLSIASPEKVNIKIVADLPLDTTHPAVLFEKWGKAEENQSLLSFDTGIQPLEDNPWTRGKCGLKLIQYMATGLPSVADPVGVATEMIENGITGFLPTSAGEWRGALEELARNVPLRKRMGKTARHTAEERYSLQTWGPKVAEIVASAVE